VSWLESKWLPLKHRPKPDDQLKQMLSDLATQYPRYGYLMLHGLLKGEGLVVNKKRTYQGVVSEPSAVIWRP